jgi:hypothetical protein
MLPALLRLSPPFCTLDLQPDFFDYFSAVEPILDGDQSLLAASAWADIGQPQFVVDPTRVYRSDFFPGLGWMLTKHVRSAAPRQQKRWLRRCTFVLNCKGRLW